MNDLIGDEGIRHLAISLLTVPTARDKQRRIGASDLSNGCDRCLAGKFLGDSRETPMTARTWMGRVLGTAFHGVLEGRIAEVLDFTNFTPEEVRHAAGVLGLPIEARAEVHTFFAELRGYGPVGGTIDLELPGEIVDWKGSTRKKLCLLIDFMQTQKGLPAPYGRTHKEIKLSEKQYAEEMEKMAYKVQGYYGQQTLYMHGKVQEGEDVRRATLVFLNRDGTGFFDVPSENRYDDEKAVHDVHVIGFNYNAAYAESLIARGQAIWDYLEAGGEPTAFPSHPQCFPCGLEKQAAVKAAETPDIEAKFGAAA
jgi:hypothetical protein